MPARLLLPALASAVLTVATPAPPAQNVLAANRLGLVDYCLTAHLLDVDEEKASAVLARRRRGAGDAGDDAHDKGVDGKVLQGSVFIDMPSLGAQLNRPTRWLCNEAIGAALKPEPLPPTLQ